MNNPDIVVATEVHQDYLTHEDHFKTAQWGHFSGMMVKYPPRSIYVKTYDASETKYSLDDRRLSSFSSAKEEDPTTGEEGDHSDKGFCVGFFVWLGAFMRKKG